MLQSMPRRAVLGLLVLGAAVAGGLVISPSSVVAAVDSVADDPIRFGLVVASLYLVRPLLAWPTTPLAVVVGYGYGVALGVPIALTGVVVTVVPVFLAVRWFSAEAVDAKRSALPFGGALERSGRAVDAYYETTGPVRGVIVSRLAPIPSDVSTCGAAVGGVSLRHLLVGTAIGELPWTAAAVVVGASAATISAEGVGPTAPLLTVGCLLAAAMLLAGPVYRVATGEGRASHDRSVRN